MKTTAVPVSPGTLEDIHLPANHPGITAGETVARAVELLKDHIPPTESSETLTDHETSAAQMGQPEDAALRLQRLIDAGLATAPTRAKTSIPHPIALDGEGETLSEIVIAHRR